MQTPFRIPEPPRRTEPVHVPLVVEERCPDPASHYACRTIAGLDAAEWATVLGERFAAGYRLLQVVPSDSASLLVFVHDHR